MAIDYTKELKAIFGESFNEDFLKNRELEDRVTIAALIKDLDERLKKLE